MSNRDNSFAAFLAGFFAGGLVGAAAALLFAPQAGEETRAQIQQKSIELRDQAARVAEETSAQTKERLEKAAEELRKRANELQERAKELQERAETLMEEAQKRAEETVSKVRGGKSSEPASTGIAIEETPAEG